MENEDKDSERTLDIIKSCSDRILSGGMSFWTAIQSPREERVSRGLCFTNPEMSVVMKSYFHSQAFKETLKQRRDLGSCFLFLSQKVI